MSDIALKSEIKTLIKKSGYKQTRELLCPIIKVVSMRHRSVPTSQIYKVAKEVLW